MYKKRLNYLLIMIAKQLKYNTHNNVLNSHRIHIKLYPMEYNTNLSLCKSTLNITVVVYKSTPFLIYLFFKTKL